MTTTITITLPSDELTATVAKQAFAGRVSAMPDVALAKIFTYGWQQIFNDAAVGAAKFEGTDEERAAFALSLAQKRYDALTRGEIGRAPRTAKPGEDAVTAEARKIATATLRAKLKKMKIELSADEFEKRVEARMSLAEVIAEAEANVARKARLAAITDLDLGDL